MNSPVGYGERACFLDRDDLPTPAAGVGRGGGNDTGC
nr:MAG TPA: hypothetical protein [Caudoviricetes sp.]